MYIYVFSYSSFECELCAVNIAFGKGFGISFDRVLFPNLIYNWDEIVIANLFLFLRNSYSFILP